MLSKQADGLTRSFAVAGAIREIKGGAIAAHPDEMELIQ